MMTIFLEKNWSERTNELARQETKSDPEGHQEREGCLTGANGSDAEHQQSNILQKRIGVQLHDSGD